MRNSCAFAANPLCDLHVDLRGARRNPSLRFDPAEKGAVREIMLGAYQILADCDVVGFRLAPAPLRPTDGAPLKLLMRISLAFTVGPQLLVHCQLPAQRPLAGIYLPQILCNPKRDWDLGFAGANCPRQNSAI